MALDELKVAEDITVDTDDVQIILGEYMWDHTSFRIGGAADVYVRPLSEEGLLGRVGGLGIFLVKNTMDKIEYARKNNKNVLTAEKNIV